MAAFPRKKQLRRGVDGVNMPMAELWNWMASGEMERRKRGGDEKAFAREQAHLRRVYRNLLLEAVGEGAVADFDNNTCRTKLQKVPMFGASWKVEEYGDMFRQSKASRILCTIASTHGRNLPKMLCPMLPALVHLLLEEVDESSTFSVLQGLLKRSGSHLCTENTTRGKKTYPKLCLELVSKYNNPLGKHLSSLRGGKLLQRTLWTVFHRFLVDVLSRQSWRHFTTVFLFEGEKILVRFVVALLFFHEKQLLKFRKVQQVRDHILANRVPFHALAKIAFSIRNLKRKTLDKRHSELASLTGDDTSDSSSEMKKDEHMIPAYTPRLINVTDEDCPLVNIDHARHINSWLPPLFKLCDFKKIFSTWTDGFSLSRLYESIMAHDTACLLLVSPASSSEEKLVSENEQPPAIFGAFCSGNFCPKHGYNGSTMEGDYRNLDCMIFRLQPSMMMYKVADPTPSSSNIRPRDRLLRATEENLQIGMDSGSLASSSALFLDERLRIGFSGCTDVFQNAEPISGLSESKFLIGQVEAYSLVSG